MTKKFLVVALLAAVAFALVASPVEAGHTSAGGQFSVFRGDILIRQFGTIEACDATSCHVDVTGVSKADLRRIVKACGGDQVTLIVPAASPGAGAFCSGNAGAWTVHLAVGLIDATGAAFATHDSDVTVEVQAHP